MTHSTSSRLAIIYMGGTFGCVGEPLAPMPAQQFIQQLQQLDLSQHAAEAAFFVAPAIADSSAYTAREWLALVAFIQQLQQQDFSRFVVIHGTDTLSYATALVRRFISPALTVVFTGSQLPLLNVAGTQLRTSSDALDNLHFAIECALQQPQGVYLAFAQRCLAHGEAIKMHSTDFDAFATQQRQALTRPTANIAITEQYLQQVQQCAIVNFMVQPLHLSVLEQQLTQLLQPKAPDFVILQGFGVANLSVNDAIVQRLHDLHHAGCLVVLTTQVPQGAIEQAYAINSWVNHAPIVLSDTASHADLYAKLIQLYLLYPDLQARLTAWQQH